VCSWDPAQIPSPMSHATLPALPAQVARESQGLAAPRSCWCQASGTSPVAGPLGHLAWLEGLCVILGVSPSVLAEPGLVPVPVPLLGQARRR